MRGEWLHFCIGGLVGAERFVKPLSFEQEYALEEGVRFDDPDKAHLLLLWLVLGAFLLRILCM